MPPIRADRYALAFSVADGSASPDHEAQAGVERDTHYRAALGSDPSEIAQVRADIDSLACRHGFGDRAGDLVLALDEVIANAQEHGAAPIVIEAWVDGRIVIEVSDVGRGFDRDRVWNAHPPTPYGQRGRGLWITRQLTDCISIRSSRQGTTVRIELSPDPHIGA